MRKSKYKLVAFPKTGGFSTYNWGVYSIDQQISLSITHQVLVTAANQRKLYDFGRWLGERYRKTGIPDNAQFLWELWNTKTDG